MEIKRNGWLYKIAYGYLSSWNQPGEVSLCKLVWRLPYSLFIAWPCVIVLLGIGGAILAVIGVFYYVCLSFVGFFIAWRPSNNPKRYFEPYKKWPCIKGVRILPVYFVVIWVVGVNISDIIQAVAEWTIYSKAFWVTAASIALFVFLIKACKFADRLETVLLFKEYLRARKQKYCPILKVV